MKEQNILKLAILVALLGLGFLLLYSGEVDLQSVERIDSTLPEENVVIKGIVNRVSMQDKVIFLEIEGQRAETVDVVLFASEEIYLKKGDSVEVSGTVEEYEGKKEVIANNIVLK